MKQGTMLIATGNFYLRKARASKAALVRTGDLFWVTTTQLSNERGIACIERKGRGHISSGYAMTIANILANFKVQEG